MFIAALLVAANSRKLQNVPQQVSGSANRRILSSNKKEQTMDKFNNTVNLKDIMLSGRKQMRKGIHYRIPIIESSRMGNVHRWQKNRFY